MKNLSPKAHQTVSYLVAVAIVALVVFFASVAHAAFSDPHEAIADELSIIYQQDELRVRKIELQQEEHREEIRLLEDQKVAIIKRLNTYSQAATALRSGKQ